MTRRNFLQWCGSAGLAMVPLVGFFTSLLPGCGDKRRRSSPPILTMPYQDVNGYATALAATKRAYGEFNVAVDSSGRVFSINGDSGPMHYLVDGVWISNAAGTAILGPGTHSLEWWEVDLASPDLYNQRRIRRMASFQVAVI